MSLNEFFAANPGGVYLRPVGLTDCFTMPGLPHGCKPPPPPPPLTMQHPCPPGPQKPRTMAAVSPLHQVTPPQTNLAAYEAATANSLNAFGSSQRTSSFAAALRKLAKQAGDPITGEKDMTQISPVSSPALAQRSLTPKRNGGGTSAQSQTMYLGSNNVHQVTTSFPSSSPPVVTIAPSRPLPTHTSDSRKLQVMDLAGMSQSNQNSSVTNGHLSDPISLKLDVTKSSARSSTAEKWEEHTSKSLPTSSGSSSQSRPHATIAPLPRPDDSLTSSRGFQPYRSADDIRTSMPHHLSPFEPHPQASYPYAPAFLPPPHLPHPAYRFDDPLFLDRFGLLRSPVMPFHAQPAMMATPAAFYPQSRYDLLAQSLSLSNSSLHLQERLKLEEERRQREKEVELDLSRKREQERREKEQKEKEHKEREKERKEKEKNHREKIEHSESNNNNNSNTGNRANHHPSASHAKRNEQQQQQLRRNDPPLINSVNQTSPPVTSSSTPLNLVVHPTPAVEHQKRETTELWVPWQQQQHQHHHPPHHNGPSKDSSHEDNTPNVHVYRTPAVHPQVENHQIPHPQKEPPPPPIERFQPPYTFPVFPDKKNGPLTDSNSLDNDQKRGGLFPLVGPAANINNINNSNNSVVNNNYRKFDSIHHHITELSKKDNVNNNSNNNNNNNIINSSNNNSSTSNEWKHEKLQKAYANNHRKNVTEVKKLREESQHSSNNTNNSNNINSGVVNGSSPHHSAQRKHYVNGLIKPVLSQDEGMHARLLETEKCRLEFNNHSVSKIFPTVPNDKPQIVPAMLPANLQLNGADVSSQYFMEQHIMSALKKGAETTPVRSKLDKEAEDMKKKGFVDDQCDDVPLKEFLVITKGPPLPLDVNPKKMRFLKLFGLTSRLKRKQIELDIYLKRRKVLHEDENCLPLEMEPEQATIPDGTTLLESVKNLDKLSERLRSEARPEKCEFFVNLGLSPLNLIQKEERAKFRKIVEEERKRREQRLLAKDSKAEVKSKTEKDDVKAEETTAGRHPTKSTSVNSTKSNQHSEQVPYANAAAKEESTSNSNGSVHVFVAPQEPDDFKRNKFRTKYSFKRGHSLKCEWKPTLMPPPGAQNNHGNGSVFVKNEAKAIASVATQADLASANDSLDDKSKNSFNWPGLEVVIEAYYRHHKEQASEKDVLKERCNQLRRNQEELTQEANQLSKTMSDLLKQKRELDDQRFQQEQALQKLKQFIQAAR